MKKHISRKDNLSNEVKHVKNEWLSLVLDKCDLCQVFFHSYYVIFIEMQNKFTLSTVKI
jgi:hypothetical protein